MIYWNINSTYLQYLYSYNSSKLYINAIKTIHGNNSNMQKKVLADLRTDNFLNL